MRDCGRVGDIWDELRVERIEGVGFGKAKDWIEEMMKSMGVRECAEFMTSCWAIWEDQKKLVFEGENGGAARVVRRVRELMWEMKVGVSSERGSEGGMQGRGEEVTGWTKPSQGRVKVNVDAAVMEGIGVGWGSVGRDEHGKVVWCTVTQQGGEMSVAMAEAVGILKGLQEARMNGQTDVDVESDC
ncbi:uncharacterized protein LOC141641777 [Silene latifolia]|uniref:uncharacterized protein LOC141641777 n=1 Tax=Silene latifolia TaxID=37657 RepID=UPI003D76E200